MEKLKVNKEACISCGACISMVPKVFEFGDDDRAEVKVKQIPDDLKDEVMVAVAGCPTDAIVYENSEEEIGIE